MSSMTVDFAPAFTRTTPRRRGGEAARVAPRLRITKRGRTVVAVLVAIPLAVGATAFGFGAAGQQAAATSSSGALQYVTVGAGQSLWSIAETVAPKSDPRDVIADIVDLNRLESADVHVGERLALPAVYTR